MNTKIVKTVLSSKIASILRIKIMKGIYKDGEHLNEVWIAKEHDLSRGPVREAINILENEGFVRTPNNGRTVAVAFTHKDFLDYHEIRFFLEAEAIKSIIQNASEEKDYASWIDVMEKLVVSMEKNTGKYQEETFNNSDYVFHKRLMERSNNRMALKVWDSLSGIRDAIMVVNKDYLVGHDITGMLFEPHRKIFEGLKELDKNKATKYCKLHMDNSIKIYENAYK